MSNGLIIKELVSELNRYRDAYYNKNEPLVSDKKYDELFDKLVKLEKETGIVLSDSPTVTVGYKVSSGLKTVTHEVLMLSLDKTKSIDEVREFIGTKDGILMYKLDGLTVALTYDNGELVRAETRGNGEEGQNILDNAVHFKNVPLKISNKDHLVVFGEAIIDAATFIEINSELPDDKKYKNCRNLASGTVTLLDSAECARRGIQFCAWRFAVGSKEKLFSKQLEELRELGFDIVDYSVYKAEDISQEVFNDFQLQAQENGIPIDGLVIGYNDAEYMLSLGATSHHLRGQLAFKFEDESEESRLLGIEWSGGTTGVLTPVAIFEPVELAGTTVTRASLHNISVMKSLGIKKNCDVVVIKANEIIPQILESYGGDDDIEIPKICPFCGAKTDLITEKESTVLRCTNDECPSKVLMKLCRFVSKDGMNIKGLSEETLRAFYNQGWVKEFADIYKLKNFEKEMKRLEGFGARSVKNIFDAIEKSRHNVKLNQFINALSIPQVGKGTAKTIAKHIGTYKNFYKALVERNAFFWSELPDIGELTAYAIVDWGTNNSDKVSKVAKYLDFEEAKVKNDNSTVLNGASFVITGKLNHFSKREDLVAEIEKYGGKYTSSVSKNTTYLINNDSHSASSKNKKANQLGVSIITEEEFLSMIH